MQFHDLPRRSLPSQVKTAYPRKQEDCLKPESGLSSIEAIYTAYEILGWKNDSLLGNYPFKQRFLEINEDFLDKSLNFKIKLFRKADSLIFFI